MFGLGAYADFSHLAPLARIASPLPPRQGANGDCWLLTAAFGLQRLFPRVITSMMTLGDARAVVVFPRAGAVSINYIFACASVARLSRPFELHWALLQKALCLLLFLKPRLLPRQPRFATPHYQALNGGFVKDGLELLSPVRVAVPIPLQTGLESRALAALGGRGLLFLEILRGRALHSLLITDSDEEALISYDPWGFVAALPRNMARTIWYYQLDEELSI